MNLINCDSAQFRALSVCLLLIIMHAVKSPTISRTNAVPLKEVDDKTLKKSPLVVQFVTFIVSYNQSMTQRKVSIPLNYFFWSELVFILLFL